MFNKTTPEACGIRSADLLAMLKKLENGGHTFHSVLLTRGENLLFEAYWHPFAADMPHRMYSVTKSFTAMAVGVLVGQGKVDLDRPFYTYFPDYDSDRIADNLKKQTVRHMLKMTTAACPSDWFTDKPDDRLAHYLYSHAPRTPEAWFLYDSEGSFALGCLVERVSGMKLLDFMRLHFLDEIGFSREARMLSCPGDHAWADSALLCTTRDMARFAKLVADEGVWNGKQLIDRRFVREAVSLQSTPTLNNNLHKNFGYGYQIWKPRADMFSFHGMGNQFVIALPAKELIFACTSDCQSEESNTYAEILFRAVIDLFDGAANAPLAADAAAETALADYADTRILRAAIGDSAHPLTAQISGKTFTCEANPMGWAWFRFDFADGEHSLTYQNAQGKKTLRFRMGENVFQKFPQAGYSDEIGSQCGKDGHFYDCAVSAAWQAGNQLSLLVQVIDDYFGRLSLNFCFPESNRCGFFFSKCAENFFNEYCGFGNAFAE